MNRQCPDCKVELTEIDLIIRNPHEGDGSILYSIGERVPKRGLLGVNLGVSQTQGRVIGMTCPRCTRVLLFAVPSAG